MDGDFCVALREVSLVLFSKMILQFMKMSFLLPKDDVKDESFPG